MSVRETAKIGNDPFYAPQLSVHPATPDVSTNDPETYSLHTSPTFASSIPAAARDAVNKITETVKGPLVEDESEIVTVADPKTGNMHSMTKEELRRQYEDEEVDRFLRVFYRQVHEVQAPQELPPGIPRKDDSIPRDAAMPLRDEFATDDDEEWHIEPEASFIPASLKAAAADPKGTATSAANVISETTTAAAQTVQENAKHTHTLLKDGEWHGRSPAEYVAMEWIVPYLPRPHRKTYQFTLGGMQGTVTRLYLACQPLYAPFMARMWSLMTWENPRRSFLFCLLFWTLWFFDLLMPALMARLCFSLIRRRIMPYPTTQELIERRNAEARADAVGDSIHAYLDASVAHGVRFRDAWTMFRIASKSKKNKAKNAVDKTTDKSLPPTPGVDEKNVDDDWAHEDENMRRFGLALMEEMADFHERFANLIHWRDPGASTRYTIILGVMAIVAIFAPYKYVIKGTYAAGGFGFWFAPNLWMALPLEHRSRIPPPLADVPTDAEYAMTVISQRVDRGEVVLPPELRSKKDRKNTSTTTLTSQSHYDVSPTSTFSKNNRSATSFGTNSDMLSPTSPTKPKGFTGKLANATLTDQTKRKETFGENGEPLAEQTFPAKYHSSMGMMCLTSERLLFYPMMSSSAKVDIPLSDIRGVKKAGRMGGLRIKYTIRGDEPTTSQSVRKYVEEQEKEATGGDTASIVTSAANGEPLEKEEKFGWISGRDEVFAKLVSWGNRRWVKM